MGILNIGGNGLVYKFDLIRWRVAPTYCRLYADFLKPLAVSIS